MKKFVNLLTDPANHNQEFHIKKTKQIILDKRLVFQKPISDFIRKPRPLTEKHDFKANEFRSLLFYYMRFGLAGLLPQKYINHFILFYFQMQHTNFRKVDFH